MSKLTLKDTDTPSLSESEQKRLGEQLTHCFHAAVNGLVEYVKLGALMEQIRRVDSTRGANSSRGPQTKGQGLKAWLSTYAPEVTEATAWRCFHLAEAVRAEFKLGPRTDLYRVLKGESLDGKDQSRRDKIVSFIAGKSQRQLLLSIGTPGANAGGARSKTKKLSAEEEQAEWVESARSAAKATLGAFHSLEERWKLLEDDELRLAVENAEKFTKQAKKWLETPTPSRAQLEIAKYLSGSEEKA